MSVEQIIVSDDFNRADGTLGTNWFGPDGLNPPNIDIVTLRAHGTANSLNRANWGAPTGLSTTFLTSGGSHYGAKLTFRGTTNAAAEMRLGVGNTTGSGIASLAITLAAGVWKIRFPFIDEVVIPAPVDGDILKLTVDDTTAKGYLNGVHLVTSSGVSPSNPTVAVAFTLKLDVFADDFAYFILVPITLDLTADALTHPFGTPFILTATTDPSSATGTVTFKEGSTVLGSATLVAGVASLVVSGLTVGVHTVNAIYNGDDTTSNNLNLTVTTAQSINIGYGSHSTTKAVKAHNQKFWFNEEQQRKLRHK